MAIEKIPIIPPEKSWTSTRYRFWKKLAGAMKTLARCEASGGARAAFQYEDEGSGDPVLVFRMDRGERYRISEVEYQGNTSQSDQALKGIVQARPASFLRRGTFTDRIAARGSSRSSVWEPTTR